MNRLALILLGVAVMALTAAGCRQETASALPATAPAAGTAGRLVLTDDLGQVITLPHPPTRIVTLAPSLTEAAFALGLGDRIVGVTTFCNYPPEALLKERIGGYVNASHEKIVSLAPDLVLATRGTPRNFMDSVRQAGIPVLAVDQTGYDQVVASIALIARACGVTERGQEVARNLQRVRQEISEKAASLSPEQRPRALIVLSLQPLFISGPGSFQHEMLVACGADDASGIPKPFGALSEEAVVQADPQVLVFPSNDNGQPVTVEGQLRRLEMSAAWKNVSAVKNRRIIVLNVDQFSIPGPRLELAFRDLAAQLHPELFKHD